MAENNYPLRFNFIANVADFNQKLGQVSGKLKSFSAGVGRLGTTLTTSLTLPLAIAGGGAFKMAADFQESLNKVDVSFKKNAKEVKNWSKTTLKEFGMSQAQALETASLFGDMGTGMGQTTEEAAKMSINLSGLSADLASFKNIRQDVAQTALASVYTGETESLKKLGIVMTETNLAEFARNKGIKKNIKDMTQMEKVELRYQFVMDRTKNAQGDFARTSGSASNQLRTLKNTLVEVGTQIGSILMPVVTKIINKVKDWVNGFIALDGASQIMIVTTALLVAGLGPLLKLLSGISGVLAFMLSPIGLVISGMIALGASFIYIRNNWEAMKERISDWSWWKNMLIDMVKFLTTTLNPFSRLIDMYNMARDFFGMNPILNPFKDWGLEILDSLKDTTAEYEHEFGTFGDAINAEWQRMKPMMDKIAKFFGFTSTGFSTDDTDTTDPDDIETTVDNTIEKTSKLSDLFNNLGTQILPQVGQALMDGFAAIGDGESPIKRVWTLLKGLITRLIAAAAAAFVLSTVLGGLFGGVGPDKLKGMKAFKDNPELIIKQMNRYKEDSYPENNGLVVSTI